MKSTSNHSQQGLRVVRSTFHTEKCLKHGISHTDLSAHSSGHMEAAREELLADGAQTT